jgi:uncharacterized membrane protein
MCIRSYVVTYSAPSFTNNPSREDETLLTTRAQGRVSVVGRMRAPAFEDLIGFDSMTAEGHSKMQCHKKPATMTPLTIVVLVDISRALDDISNVLAQKSWKSPSTINDQRTSHVNHILTALNGLLLLLLPLVQVTESSSLVCQ